MPKTFAVKEGNDVPEEPTKPTHDYTPARDRSLNDDSSTQDVASPCVGTCLLTPEGHCIGCGRTGDEIGAWSRLTGEQKRRVVTAAADRIRPASPPQ